MTRTRWWMLCGVLGGCGVDEAEPPEPPEPAPLAAVCGEAGPVRLLALDPDERVAASDGFMVVGERLLVVAGKGDKINPVGALLFDETTVYAVGPCGEEPVVVARDVERIYSEPRFAGVVFGCTLDRDLVRLDPSGMMEPMLLARGACWADFTEHGLLQYDAGEDGWTVDFYPLLDAAGPWFGEPARVAEPVRTVNAATNSVRALNDEVLMVEDGELARYELPSRERSVLADDVVVFAASDDGRFLFYQGPGSGEDKYNPIGPIYARDRESGVGGPIGSGVLTLAEFVAPDVLAVDVFEGGEHQRLVRLPEFEFIEVPAGHEVVARLADGRWLTRGDFSGPWSVFDAESGQISAVSAESGRIRGARDEHLDLLLSVDQSAQGMGAYVRYFYDGRAPLTLAERANVGAVVGGDGRVRTLVDVDEEALGTLTVVDPSTTKGLRIDERVSVVSNLEVWVHPTEEGAVIYGVVDGERSGVWAARPE